MHHNELNQMIGRLFNERDELHRCREATALLILEVQRHGQAIAHLVEQLTTSLVGIRSDGTLA